jgi:hypothetical protein
MAVPQFKAVLVATPQMRSESGLTFRSIQSAVWPADPRGRRGCREPAPESVQKLQMTLHAKAKGSPKYRFHAVYDKVYREDILAFAYECCKAKDEQQAWTVRISRTSKRTASETLVHETLSANSFQSPFDRITNDFSILIVGKSGQHLHGHCVESTSIVPPTQILVGFAHVQV